MLKNPFRKSLPEESWQRQLYRCQGCGLCVNACPLGSLSPAGLLAPRARIMLIRAFLEGRLSRKEARSAFSTCLHCGQCEKTCPAGLPLREIFQEFTALPGNAHDNPPHKALYLLQALPSLSSALQPALALLSRTRIGEKLTPMFRDLPLKSFAGFSRTKNSSRGADGAILLFGGCLSKNIDPGIAKACADLARKSGRPLISPSLPCCGRINRIMGKKGESIALARKNLKLLSALNFEYILTPCPACALELGQAWPAIKGLDKKERAWAESLAEKVLDPTTFMRKIQPQGFVSQAARDGAFFHISCLGPSSNRTDLEHFFPGSKTTVAEDGENCCGASLLCAGERKQAERRLSDSLGRKLRDRALAQGAKAVYTTCPACKLRLRQIMARQGDSVLVLHIAELYARLAGDS